MSERRRDDDREEPRRRTVDRDEPRGRDRDDRGRDDRGRDEPRRSSRDDDRGRDEPRRSSRDDRDEPRRSSRDDDRGGRGGARGFVYQARTAEEVKERAERGASDFDKILKPSVKMFKVRDGDNRIRILPATWPGAKHYGLDLWVHYGVGADRGAYLDLTKMLKEPDPITEERERARNEDNPDEKYVKELDSKRRVLVYLIDRDDEKAGVQAWAMPWTVDRDITKVSVDKDTGEVLNPDHPDDGYDVTFEKKGKGDRTEYLAIGLSRRSSPLGRQAWLEHAMDYPLPDQLQYYDYEHIAKAFGAKGEQRDSRGGRDDNQDRGRDDRDDPRGRDSGRERTNRERDDRDDRGGRDRDSVDRRYPDDPPARGRQDDTPTWASVHDMTHNELLDTVDQERLDINPRDAKDDADLADWICEELKLKKPEPAPTRRRVDSDDAPEDRLATMRRDRERRD